MHPTRARRLSELNALAVDGDWEEIYRRFTLWEFPTEVRMGFQLAFLRPFAVPRMAEVLLNAGIITGDPTRRAYHTGIVIHEIIVDGLDGPRGRRMVAHMNRAHRRPGVLQVDLTCVLCAFIVVPVRYTQAVGWRAPTAVEIEASFRFYRRMGSLMNIEHIPESYAAAAQMLDDYEREHVAPSSAGQRLGADIVAVLRRRLPRFARGVAEPLFVSQLASPAIADAVGLRSGGKAARAVVPVAIRVRRYLTRHRPAASAPSFTPGQSAGPVYPHGYSLDQIDRI